MTALGLPPEPDPIEELEHLLATEFYQATMDWSNDTARSQQDQNFVIGISSIGHCSEKVRRMLMREEPTQTPDKLAAFLGTWIGEGVEQAILKVRPDAIIQSNLELDLDTDQGHFTIGGHPDVILPEGIVLDNKTVDGLAKVSAYKLFETDLQKKFQRHGYGYAAWKQGLFGDLALEDVKVGNMWIDRSGSDHKFIVKLEPLDLTVIEEMQAWLSEVVYAFVNKVEARKEPAREFCATWCEFFSTCRAHDTDVEGLITDQRYIGAIDMYKEGGAMESAGKKLKAKAKAELEGVSGSTGVWSLRWVEVPEASIAPGIRRAHTKISLSKVK